MARIRVLGKSKFHCTLETGELCSMTISADIGASIDVPCQFGSSCHATVVCICRTECKYKCKSQESKRSKSLNRHYCYSILHKYIHAVKHNSSQNITMIG